MFLNSARADHVGALADDQRAVAVFGFDQLDAGDSRRDALDCFGARGVLRCSHLRDRADVRRRGAAAAADDVQPAVIDEALELRGETMSGVSPILALLRSAARRSDSRKCAVVDHFVQGADVIGHELRAGGAVQADETADRACEIEA